MGGGRIGNWALGRGYVISLDFTWSPDHQVTQKLDFYQTNILLAGTYLLFLCSLFVLSQNCLMD